MPKTSTLYLYQLNTGLTVMCDCNTKRWYFPTILLNDAYLTYRIIQEGTYGCNKKQYSLLYYNSDRLFSALNKTRAFILIDIYGRSSNCRFALHDSTININKNECSCLV
uniref:Uncharacterized protein n=1 Tax=Daphnia magna TaxID=35525 RepID=A0A0P6HMP0_9CRUS